MSDLDSWTTTFRLSSSPSLKPLSGIGLNATSSETWTTW
jgi:hypothetical protein